MRPCLLALALCATGVPAFAAGPEAMSCADFARLDAAGKAATMASGSTGEAGGMMASSEDAGGMMAADHGAMAAAACAAHPEMTVGAAMTATQ